MIHWLTIDLAPREGLIVVYCPPYQDLPELVSLCEWHPDGGFCVDELREPTHFARFDRPGTPEQRAA